ncbi:MAG: reverse transcriptase-like protein [Lachnospiraceae bacterium]|nr:reverse transcriptase-like protein [Lachnospiraceae bacterium]
MAKKYYAVKIGKTPGIYYTWDDCKAQVEGYKGAVYKGFASIEEADAFINMDASVSVKADNFLEIPKGTVVAYVDGSFSVETNEYGYGAVVFCNGEEIHLSGKGSQDYMISMRNVAGEIIGSRVAMEFAIEKKCEKLIIYHDYEGIAKWCLGEWKTNKKGTIEYKEYFDSIKNKINIEFIKVKGHSGDKYNELADKLAKGSLGIAT